MPFTTNFICSLHTVSKHSDGEHSQPQNNRKLNHPSKSQHLHKQPSAWHKGRGHRGGRGYRGWRGGRGRRGGRGGRGRGTFTININL